MSIRFERDERGGVSVWVDGQPQSYVVPADPRLLAFEYVEQLAIVIDSIAPSAARLARVPASTPIPRSSREAATRSAPASCQLTEA